MGWWAKGFNLSFTDSPKCVPFCPEWLLVGKGLTLTGEGSIVWKYGVDIRFVDIS